MTAHATIQRPLGRVGRVALAGLFVGGTALAASDPLSLLSFLPYGAVGAFLAVRRPTNSIGWLLIVIAFGFSGTTTTPGLDVAALLRGDATLHDTLSTWLAGWAGLASYVGFLALTIVFPDGRLPKAGGRRTAITLLVAGVAIVIVTAIAPTISLTLPGGSSTVDVPNPVAVLPDLPIWTAVPLQSGIFLALIALLVIGVIRMVRRYRRAIGVERLQLRWLVAAVVFMLVGVVAGLGSIAVAGNQIGGAAWIPVFFAYPTIPLAIGFAVLRYRLYAIDRIISRTIAYGAVTAVLGGLFVAVILGLQALLAPITSGQTIAVAASTLVVYALFQPVLRRVRGSVDRRFDRARYDADLTVRTFAARLRGDIDLGIVRSEILDTAISAVRPTKAGVWLRATRAERTAK